MLLPMAASPPAEEELRPEELHALAEWRYQVRRFQARAEEMARAEGIEPQHHHALVTIKGLPRGQLPTVGVIAERMAVRHHSAVELIDRLVARGIVRREPFVQDRRVVLVLLTPQAEAILHRLAGRHRRLIRSAAPALIQSLTRILRGGSPAGRVEGDADRDG